MESCKHCMVRFLKSIATNMFSYPFQFPPGSLNSPPTLPPSPATACPFLRTAASKLPTQTEPQGTRDLRNFKPNHWLRIGRILYTCVWMCSLDVRFTVACVFDVIFEFSTLKITLKTHSTVKRTSKLHIQNASVINP
jgi:hypothetical protein